MLDELNTYKGKLFYYIETDGTDKESKLDRNNINFHQSIAKLETFHETDLKSHFD